MIGGFGKTAVVVLMSLALVTVAASRSEAQSKLRYRFTAHETLNYELEHDTRTIMVAATGPLLDLSASFQVDSTWEVTDVASDGKATIMVRFNRIQFRQRDLAGNQVSYDTNDDKEPTDPLMKFNFGVLKSLVGPDVVLNLDSMGNMTNVKVAERAATALAKLPENSGSLLNEDGLKRLLRRAWLNVPEQPVAKDKPWQESSDIKQYRIDENQVKSELASVKTDFTYNWDGKADVNGKSLDRITIKAAASIKLDEKFVKATISDQASEGTALFDSAAGRLVEVAVKQRTTMTISIGSMSVDESVGQETSLKLKTKSK